eukprot:m.616927 g.616927  ORF g.616927 m.616927 type:complete len:79 (-) comp22517_c0_seq6:113-349(-)
MLPMAPSNNVAGAVTHSLCTHEPWQCVIIAGKCDQIAQFDASFESLEMDAAGWKQMCLREIKEFRRNLPNVASHPFES